MIPERLKALELILKKTAETNLSLIHIYLEFVRQVYPKMCSLMEFCEGQLDENGFLVGRENDWIYIDWADMDKTCLLYTSMLSMARQREIFAGL